MTAASLEPLATAGSEAFITYAILLSFTVGIFQFLLGLRLGVVVNFLSHPVIVGFTNAAALIIASSQLSKFFGVYVDKADHHYETVIQVFEASIIYTHWPTLIIGCSSFIVMLVLKKIAPRFPNILAVVALAILISYFIGFEHNQSASIEEFRSTSAKDMVLELSIHSVLLSNLKEERAQIYRKLNGLQNGTPAWIATWKEYDLLSHNIRKAKSKVTSYRRQVREMLFARVKKGREAGYYLKTDVPVGIPTDGRTWRLQVGSKPLNATHLMMIGGGSVVGQVPSGLPSFGVPAISASSIRSLLAYAVIIAILGFMEAISIAKAMAAKTGARLDPNQKLIGQGLGNIVGAFGQSYPTSGSFSRSAVNLQAGALTGISSVITSLTVVVVLILETKFSSLETDKDGKKNRVNFTLK